MYIAGSSSSSRITGMVSGMDIDSMVENLMLAEMDDYNTTYQNKVMAEWELDAYREVTTEITAFEDSYFNFSNADSNMLAQSSYLNYTCSSSDSSCVTISTSGSVSDQSHTVEVSQLATYATCSGTSSITSEICSSGTCDYDEANGLTLSLTLDGTSRDLAIDSTITDADSLQNAIDSTFGSGKITVEVSGDGLAFDVVSGSGVQNLSLDDSDDDVLAALGFVDGDTTNNRLCTTDTLEDIAAQLKLPFTFDSNSQLNFTINGIDFTFDETDSLDDLLEDINSSDAGVTLSYDSLNDQFSLEADESGAGDTLAFSETDSTFFDALGFTTITEGQDAIMLLDGEQLTRSSNCIEVDGITYELKDVSTEEITVSTSFDSQAMYDLIETFVTDYNALVTSLDDAISEEYDYNYPPLTEAQEDDMTEDEIDSWNALAQYGILENDSVINSMLKDLRSLAYSSVEGCDLTFYEIGITTGSYEEGGILNIDEDTLMEAIENDPESVMNLFCQQSDSYSSTSARGLTSDEREVRTSECGRCLMSLRTMYLPKEIPMATKDFC